MYKSGQASAPCSPSGRVILTSWVIQVSSVPPYAWHRRDSCLRTDVCVNEGRLNTTGRML